jgi:hypothetical protein
MSSRYVALPNGSYMEWPEGVSAATFKAKATKAMGTTPTPNKVNESMGNITGISAYHPKTGLAGIEEKLGDWRQQLSEFANRGSGSYKVGNTSEIGDLMASVPLGAIRAAKGVQEAEQGEKWKGAKNTVGGVQEALTIPALAMLMANPLGGPMMAGKMLPSTEKAGKLIEAVEQVAGKVPVELESPTKAAMEIVQNAKSGGSRPKVIADFMRRISDTKQPPMTYAEARQFYKNAISKFAPDVHGNPLKGEMRYMLGKFAKALDRSNQGAAKQVGMEDKYVQAMKSYHRASQFESAASKVGKRVKQGIGLAVGGAATAVGAKEGYNWIKK